MMIKDKKHFAYQINAILNIPVRTLWKTSSKMVVNFFKFFFYNSNEQCRFRYYYECFHHRLTKILEPQVYKLMENKVQSKQ